MSSVQQSTFDKLVLINCFLTFPLQLFISYLVDSLVFGTFKEGKGKVVKYRSLLPRED